MNRCCAVFCGGDPVSRETAEGYLESCVCSIAADSGYLLADKLGVKVDTVIGDFDSAREPSGVEVIRFPVRKDDTDLMLALKEGLGRGYDRYVIFGATGGRLDHTFAAVQGLEFLLDRGASGVIVSDNETAEMFLPGCYGFEYREGFTLSLFAVTEKVTGLSLKGTKYDGEGLTLERGFPLGVSNAVTAPAAEIIFESGRLLAVRSRL